MERQVHEELDLYNRKEERRGDEDQGRTMQEDELQNVNGGKLKDMARGTTVGASE